MRRLIFGLISAAVVGLGASDASACCHKKKACPTPATCAPAPAPVVCAAPAPKKCHLGMGKMFKGGLCHKKAAVACAPAPAPCYETVAYAAPQSYAAPQGYAAPAAQGFPAVPHK